MTNTINKSKDGNISVTGKFVVGFEGYFEISG
jgi:hypothetical protein